MHNCRWVVTSASKENHLQLLMWKSSAKEGWSHLQWREHLWWLVARARREQIWQVPIAWSRTTVRWALMQSQMSRWSGDQVISRWADDEMMICRLSDDKQMRWWWADEMMMSRWSDEQMIRWWSDELTIIRAYELITWTRLQYFAGDATWFWEEVNKKEIEEEAKNEKNLCATNVGWPGVVRGGRQGQVGWVGPGVFLLHLFCMCAWKGGVYEQFHDDVVHLNSS